MRSKLASQAPPSAASSVTGSADMLRRLTSMFSPGLLQMRAASDELHSLQQFVRFHASREDVAWAASGTVHCILIVWQISPLQLLHYNRTQLQKVAIRIRNQEHKEKIKRLFQRNRPKKRGTQKIQGQETEEGSQSNLFLCHQLLVNRGCKSHSLSRNSDPCLNMMQEYHLANSKRQVNKKLIFIETFCLAPVRTAGQEQTLTVCFLLWPDLG